MINLLSNLDKQLFEIVSEVSRTAQQLKFHAYLVGGPVRDLILKRPNIDLDITVEGNGIRLAEKFAAQHVGAELVRYPAFKTATVTLIDGQMVDFATARKETYSRGGVFPAVVPSNLKDDLFRRDFTINAIAITIGPNALGKIIDPFKGRMDLRAKKIRILHEKSFLDDPTRIIRAARFAARLGFGIERSTLKLLKDAIDSRVLETVKPQRYMKEFNKILKEQRSKEGIQLLKSWNAYNPR